MPLPGIEKAPNRCLLYEWMKEPQIAFRACSNPVWPHFNLIKSTRSYFQIRSCTRSQEEMNFVRTLFNPLQSWSDISPKRIILIANKHMKRCSALLVIRETQFKTTMRWHITPTRMAKMKRTDNNECWWRCGNTGTLLCWCECRMEQLLGETVWQFLKM